MIRTRFSSGQEPFVKDISDERKLFVVFSNEISNKLLTQRFPINTHGYKYYRFVNIWDRIFVDVATLNKLYILREIYVQSVVFIYEINQEK